MSTLCEKLRQMSTDNSKHQHKRTRKQQRSSFRDILNSVEVGYVVIFEKGNKEVSALFGWCYIIYVLTVGNDNSMFANLLQHCSQSKTSI